MKSIIITGSTGFIGDEKGRVKKIRCLECRLGEPDASGRRRPVPIEGSEFELLTLDSPILAKTRQLAIEIHDFAGDRKSLREIIKLCGFTSGRVFSSAGSCILLAKRVSMSYNILSRWISASIELTHCEY